MATIIYTKTDEAPAARHLLPPADRAGVHQARRHRRSRPATSPSPAASSRSSPTCSPTSSGSTTPSPNSARWPRARGQHHQAAEHLRLRPAAQGRHRRAAGARATTLPDYPENPQTDAEKDARARYDKVMGSAVNPVLREGNSDRRAPEAVKDYAKAHPHSMGAWCADSKTSVGTMGDDDFFSNEKSVTVAADDTVQIEFVGADGTTKVLKETTPAQGRRDPRRHRHEQGRAASPSSPSRSPRPRPTACSSRCT